MRFLIHLISIIYVIIHQIDANSDSNIVLSGGGNGALVMENGKGKKNEKLIIKDDALVMKNADADGNLIMDGTNLIFKEGKKHENIIIKSNSACCQQDIVHREEHVSHILPKPMHLNAESSNEHRTIVTAPVQSKKKVIHHKKDANHQNDQFDLDSSDRREDSTNLFDSTINTSMKDEINKNQHQQETKKESIKRTKSKREKKERSKIRKLRLGDRLSFKEKENLKLKRVDRRLGLGRFNLAGRMMKKIRWRKNAQKTNSKVKSRNTDSKENTENTKQSIKNDEDNYRENGEQQYDDDEDDDKDQEDETLGSNLFDGLSNSILYPALNQAPIRYMTSNFNQMIDPTNYPPISSSPVSLSSQLTSERSEKIKSKKNKKFEKYVNEDQIKTSNDDNVKSSSDLDEVNTNSQEIESNDDINKEQEDNSKLSNDNRLRDDESNSNENRSIESNKESSINYQEMTTKTSLLNKNKILQPIFTPDERQINNRLNNRKLTSTIHSDNEYPLMGLPSNAPQRQQHPQSNYPQATATLPIFTPAKTAIEQSAALLLPLIAQQSVKQQAVIRMQQKKLIEQEIKQKELTKQLQQATEFKIKNYDLKNDEQDFLNQKKKTDKTKQLYTNELDYWDKLTDQPRSKSVENLDETFTDTNDKFNKYDNEFNGYDKVPIKRIRRRKFDDYRSLEANKNGKILIRRVKRVKKDRQFLDANKESDGDFDFLDSYHNLTSEPRLVNDRKLKSKKRQHHQLSEQRFIKRMLNEDDKPEIKESKQHQNEPLSINVTKNEMTNALDDYRLSSTINEMKLGRNASLIVYGY